ncbi:hypothetical protein SEUCBS139899_004288 [Sporothrix eucalyptigena]|uniref:Uncharacterized protein n=1 Tax=Sporothrix eucalyptigena TaxID=1812306 RepID=A0ABP0BSB6_9PEZI
MSLNTPPYVPPEKYRPVDDPRDRSAFLDAEARREQRMRQQVEEELAGFSHKHTILATATSDVEAGTHTEQAKDRPIQVTLYDWCHAGAATPSLTTGPFDPHSYLSSLRGFDDLGTVRVDPEVDLLVLLAKTDEAEYDFCKWDEDEVRKRPAIAECVRQLRQRLETTAATIATTDHKALQLWTFSVLSQTESPIFVSAHDKLVWRWCKPESPYNKRSKWFTQPHDVIQDGAWNAGKNLILLVKEAPEDPLAMYQ